MSKFIHRVKYYETDKMGITHHSNYVRWMEEGRVDYLEKIGLSFAGMEAKGIASPVVSLDVKYKAPCTFDDEVEVETLVHDYTGIRLLFSYTMRNAKTGAVLVEANSSHCFLFGGKVVSMKKAFPDLDKVMTEAVERQKAGQNK
ncbi:MAG: acyl-CoA thioesterase [Clostridiales bacterium]|nr:acyl-CoA thioesterase [Clostridiales bacterium]